MRCTSALLVGWVLTAFSTAETPIPEAEENGYLDPVDISTLVAGHEKLAEEMQTSNQSVQSLLQQADQLMAEIDEIRGLREDVEGLVGDVNSLIRETCAQQLRYFSNLLEEIVSEERQRRSAMDEIHKNVGTQAKETVSSETLKNYLDPETILASGEAELQKWLVRIAEEEIDKFYEEEARKADDGNCVNPSEGAQMIQSELIKFHHDVVGMTDHAQDATVVHERTSDTFTPPAEHDRLLGNIWWRRYIAEDWEKLLPEGWEEWNAEIPPSVYHSLGLSGGATTPPETALSANTLPGYCWPMSGRSGRLTIRLQHPVEVNAISIDHVSALLGNNEADRQSAPKQIKVVGYPPCQEDCAGLGFDVQAQVDLGSFEYDMNGPSTQTFNVVEEEQDSGSCSEVTASCEAPDMGMPLGLIRQEQTGLLGITLEVLDNWGNDAFTCLYRFRVHGTIIQATA